MKDVIIIISFVLSLFDLGWSLQEKHTRQAQVKDLRQVLSMVINPQNKPSSSAINDYEKLFKNGE